MAAEDIVTDSIIRLWETMKVDHVNQISAYLFKILKTKSLDYLKHLAIRRNVHQQINSALLREVEIRINSLESADPNEIFSSEISFIIEKTLQSLPEKTREIFILSRFKNKSNKEIAEIFNISVKGVDYHIMQSTRELRLALKDYLPLLGVLSFLNI